MKFAVVLAEQLHRQVFAEVVESLSWALRELGHDVRSAVAPVDDARNIILAPHFLLATDEYPSLTPGTIVYNGEPHCSPLFVRSLRLLGRREVEVWDYSRRTTEFLLGLGIPATTVGYAWCPTHERPRTRRLGRDVDVLFMGSMSARREKILSELAGIPGLRVQVLSGVYGTERDEWLQRSRVCLNVHYWDEGGVEDLRLLHACANGVAVVSEGTPDEDYKRDWAHWVPYSELVRACVVQVKSDAWTRQAALGFASVRMHDAASVLAPLVGSSQAAKE